MPAERLTMRKIREVFRLKFECELSNRKIAKSCLVARSTVAEYLFRFKQAGLSWPLPDGMDDTQIEHAGDPADDQDENGEDGKEGSGMR